MPDYPVMFTVRDAISGNGFLAGVTISGRVTAREEDGQWWINGVRPSGIAAFGATPGEAFMRFRETYKNVLFDLAEEAERFEDFKSAVETFYFQRNEVEEACWETAFKAMRAGGVPKEGFFSGLPTQAPETRPTQCTVEHLNKQARYQATDNVSDYLALPAAA